jgi:predicted cobalt transporter CbtA
MVHTVVIAAVMIAAIAALAIAPLALNAEALHKPGHTQGPDRNHRNMHSQWKLE